MKIYFLFIIFFCACNGKEKEYRNFSNKAGIDLSKYLYQNDTIYYKYESPRLYFSLFSSDSGYKKKLKHQDSLLNTLPEANLDLVKLYYYSLIVNSLLEEQLVTPKKPASEKEKDYKISGGFTAASSAISSLSLIKSNQPFSFFLGNNNSYRFSFGQNPVIMSAIGLSLISSSGASMFDHNIGADEENSYHALRQGIKSSFYYYQYLFEIKDDLKSIIDNTLYMESLLRKQGKILVGTRIQEQYFLDYLLISGRITQLEKSHYQLFLLNFDKKLPEKFEFNDRDIYEQLDNTRITIASSLQSLQASIKSLDNRNDTIVHLKNKIIMLTKKLQEKQYAEPLEEFLFRF